MNLVRWTVAALVLALVASPSTAVAQGTAPTVELQGGVDSGLPTNDWQHAAATDVPVVLHFDDADLDIDAVVSGADSVSWNWDYTLQGEAGSNPYYGTCDVNPPSECSGDQPMVIPAEDLDASGGWFTYYLTYTATNSVDSKTAHLEVRVVDADRRPTLSVSGHDPSTDTLHHPFQLVANAAITSGINTEPILRWNGVDGVQSHDVDLSGLEHGDPVPTITAQAFDAGEVDFLGEVPSEPVTLDLTLDLAPVFTVSVPDGAVGDTLTPSVDVQFPADEAPATYEWSLGATVVGTANTLELTEGDFQRGDVVTLAVTLTNAAQGASRTVTDSVTVGNAAPVIESLSLAPLAPHHSDDIQVSVVATDPEGDALSYSYEWVRGASVSDLNVRVANAGSFAVGSQVVDGDSDFGSPVDTTFPRTLTVADIMYFDWNGDDVFSPGDEVFLDVDGSDTVTGDDITLSGASAGTLVGSGHTLLGQDLNGDADHHFALGNDRVFRAFDVDGDGAYSLDDVVYLDTTGAGLVTVQDLIFSGIDFGRAQAPWDARTTFVLSPLDFSSGSRFAFADADVDGVFDGDEELYLQPADSSTFVASLDVRIANPGASLSGTYVHGSQVRGSDPDFGNSLVDSGRTSADIKYDDVDGDGTFSAGDSLFLDMDGSDSVTVDDVALSGDDTGAVVQNGHGKLDSALVSTGLPAGDTRLSVFDGDGDGYYSLGDDVLLDLTTQGRVTPQDVVFSSTYIGYVITPDGPVDVFPISNLGAFAGGGQFVFADADADGVFDSGETVYLQQAASGTPVSGQTGATLPASATTVGEQWSVRVTATDGNGGSATATSGSVEVLPDLPTVAITGPAADAWQTSNAVPVTFTTTGGSVTTECSIDGGTTFSACQSGDALTFSEGTHVLVVRATNAAGTATDSGSVKVDATGPTVTITPSRAPDSGGWYTSAVTFTASGTDAGSGVDSCDADKQHASGDGADREVTMTCKDVLGNVGTATHTFDFDTSAPSVGVSVPQWTKGGQVTFQVSDAGSGVSSWSAQYRVDDGDWQAFASGPSDSGAYDLPSTTQDATIDFRVTATDNVGHVRALPSTPDDTTTIDKTAPGVPASFQASPRAGGAFTLSWSAPSVDGAPVDRYVVQHRAVGGSFSTLGSASERSYVANLDASDGSGHEFRVAAVDKAGNQGDFTSITSAVAHNRAPTGTLAVVSPTHGDGAAAGDEVRFSWTALIPGPGETVTYRYALSQQETLQLDADALSTTSTTAQFNDVQPGAWYFHLLGVGTTGNIPAQPLRIDVFAAITDAQVAAANKALLVTVEERAEDVLVSWTLPDDLPGTVAGVQVWSVDEDGDLTLRRTLTSDDDAFDERAYATRPAEAFVVTLFYENGEGRFSLQSPPSTDQYAAWELASVERLADAESDGDGLPLRAVLLTSGAVLLLAGLATGGFFLVRARGRAAESSPY